MILLDDILRFFFFALTTNVSFRRKTIKQQLMSFFPLVAIFLILSNAFWNFPEPEELDSCYRNAMVERGHTYMGEKTSSSVTSILSTKRLSSKDVSRIADEVVQHFYKLMCGDLMEECAELGLKVKEDTKTIVAAIFDCGLNELLEL